VYRRLHVNCDNSFNLVRCAAVSNANWHSFVNLPTAICYHEQLDNCFDEDIIAAVATLTRRKAGASPNAIAAGLIIRAFNFSLDRNRVSPWQLAAAKRRRAGSSSGINNTG
jgi:hypothetical protein